VTVSFARVTITRKRYPLVDDHGTQAADFTAAPDTSLIEGCWLEPIESQIEQGGRLAVLTGFTGVAPVGTVFDALTDHIVHDGVEYELAGDAMPVKSPTGALNEVKFSLRRWRHGG
jgi:hypothetical protein